MLKEKFYEKISKTPKYVAIFALTKDIFGDRKKGDEYYYHENGCMISVKGDKMSISPLSSNFKFIEYRKV